MRMFTKMGVTVATGALPVLLWAGAAGAQQSGQSELTDPCQSQSQSQSQCTTVPTVATSLPTTSGTGTLARTGNDNGMLPLAVGGAALAGAVVVRSGLRRRSAA